MSLGLLRGVTAPSEPYAVRALQCKRQSTHVVYRPFFVKRYRPLCSRRGLNSAGVRCGQILPTESPPGQVGYRKVKKKGVPVANTKGKPNVPWSTVANARYKGAPFQSDLCLGITIFVERKTSGSLSIGDVMGIMEQENGIMEQETAMSVFCPCEDEHLALSHFESKGSRCTLVWPLTNECCASAILRFLNLFLQ